jgi:ribonuclease-3
LTRPNSSNTGKRRRNRARAEGPPGLAPEQRDACQDAIGYRFKNPDLLDRAMTHRSATQGKTAEWSNERLEFLGDRVLGLVMVETLMERFPKLREGELAPRLNTLVSRKACAVIGSELGLGRFIIVDQSERSTGGADKPSLLANAIEAIIGAIYTDAGLDRARKVTLKHWQRLLGDTVETPRDPKSALQEWAQGAGLRAPAYRQIAREGPDHAPVFTVTVVVDGHQPLPGIGSSKQLAEREAARAMLTAIGGPV